MFRQRGWHFQEFLHVQGIQSQHDNLDMHRPHWDDYYINILKYVKLNAVKLKLRGTTPPDTTQFTRSIWKISLRNTKIATYICTHNACRI
jgi:hypothetical protein